MKAIWQVLCYKQGIHIGFCSDPKWEGRREESSDIKLKLLGLKMYPHSCLTGFSAECWVQWELTRILTHRYTNHWCVLMLATLQLMYNLAAVTIIRRIWRNSCYNVMISTYCCRKLVTLVICCPQFGVWIQLFLVQPHKECCNFILLLLLLIKGELL